MNPTYYLLIEMVSSVISLDPRPAVGPMTETDCKAVQLAIEAAAVPSIASVRCRQPRVWTSCPVPGQPPGSAGQACPVWTDGPFVGPPPDQK